MLKTRWEQFCVDIDAEAGESFIQVYEQLTSLYAAQARHYHTLEHIEHCLIQLFKARNLIENFNQVEMAIWFHDSIYQTRQKDNELKSAQFAQGACEQMGLSPDFGTEVYELIIATDHSVVPVDSDTKFLIDIDLSILGSETVEFERYEANIRKEYFWVADYEYRFRRKEILEKFLHRDSVYMTSFFRSLYEKQASRNLAQSIVKLQGA